MKPAKTQQDHNMDFDGMAGTGVNRSANRFAGNQWSGHSNDGRLVQKAQAPNRTGNDGSCDMPKNLGASVTKDPNRRPMTATMPRLPAQGSIRDNINRGPQVRNPGGTTMPKHPTNPDKINVSGYSMGDGKTSKGSRPVKSPTDVDGMNYGPKKQY